MNEARLAHSLVGIIGTTLARDLTASFLQIRTDLATNILERAAPGKFVETFVQCLQRMATGAYDTKPDVDGYLNKHAENATTLPEGLRICAARIARSIYTMRNKRNIAHKNDIDPNTYDLAYIHQGAAWIMAELVRNASGITMEEAGALIRLIEAPVGTLVEEIDGTRLVHAPKVAVRGEILILLHSHYPEYAPVADIQRSLSARSPGTVRNRLAEMCGEKTLFGDAGKGYRLTSAGYKLAQEQISAVLE